MQWWTVMSVVVLVGAFQVGCGMQSLIELGDTPTTQPQSLSTQEPVEILAGRWEYQDDAAAYPLALEDRATARMTGKTATSQPRASPIGSGKGPGINERTIGKEHSKCGYQKITRAGKAVGGTRV